MQLYPQYRVVASFPTRRSSHLMLRPMVCDTSIAENHSFANASLACMRPCASNMPPAGMFDAQGLMQANEAFRSEEHTSELQSLRHLVCRLLLEKKKKQKQ